MSITLPLEQNVLKCGKPKHHPQQQVVSSQVHQGILLPPQSTPLSPQQMPSNFLSGDWICAQCSTHNFATRNACYTCRAQKDIISPPPKNQVINSPLQLQNNVMPAPVQAPNNGKPGDWVCQSCHTNNFATRNDCFGCRQPRNAVIQSVFASIGQPAVANIAVNNNNNQPRSGRKPGDWDCPSCGCVNFATRDSCFKCSGRRK